MYGLDAVLSAIDRVNVDEIICLGDVASTGPQPLETLSRIAELNCPVVMGNCDAHLLNPVDTSTDEDMRRFNEIETWTAYQLAQADLDFITSFQLTVSIDLGRQSLLCYHGSPHSYDDVIEPATPEDELDRHFEGHAADVFAGGHTHMQMLRRYATSLVVNPGSVGMAYDRTRPAEDVRCAPWAEFGILTVEGDDVAFELRRVAYDTAPVAQAIETSGMPHADWLASGWR
jgi:predicted phosphodiesterase